MEDTNICLVLRGCSGSGKSTLAYQLAALIGNSYAICSADDYFVDKTNGEYKFVPEQLPQAHRECREKFIQALGARVKLVIVANTNTSPSHFDFYQQRAKEFGYTVHVLIVENYHEGLNQHGVPMSTLRKQEIIIKDNMRLI